MHFNQHERISVHIKGTIYIKLVKISKRKEPWMKYSTLICKLVDLIPALHQSQAAARRPAQLVLCRIAVPTTPAQTVSWSIPITNH